MKRLILCIFLSEMVMIHAVKMEDIKKMYMSRKKFKVGEWTPPPPPRHESTDLKGSVPVPTLVEEAGDYHFKQLRSDKQGSQRKLLGEDAGGGGDAGGEAVLGSKVPHNWFGQGFYVAPKYEIATGVEECKVCKLMIQTGDKGVDNGYSSEKGAEAAERNLCASIDPKYKDMCKGYLKYIMDCPSFVHNICHEDMGGSERLRAPCPEYLKCYYCLRINPLYCIDTEGLL
eukprot:GSMAST32.ASY1.ANO1.2562.1 assembled CDS